MEILLTKKGSQSKIWELFGAIFAFFSKKFYNIKNKEVSFQRNNKKWMETENK